MGEEINMYARRLTMQLRQNDAADFTRVIDSEIIALLRKQPGFRDELVLINPAASQAETISLWNTQESADTFGRSPYADMLKMIERFIKHKPQVEGYQVAKTTFTH
jgi:antibiotic biosynthesis monooxygenase (ABM) superfamily enzyme